MSKNREIAPALHYVGVDDRSKPLFEGLWPLPKGISYNSYLIVDEKVALIDTVDAAFTEELLANVRAVIGDRNVDYLVVNHMEPDHSSSIAAVRRAWPAITVVSNALALGMLEGYYGSCDSTLEIKEGQTLGLGKRDLQFFMAPMVHWPETMVTYLVQDKALFSGDAFGCFGTLDGGVTDDDLPLECYRDEMIRYYSNIVGKYGGPVQKALRKLSPVEVKLLCSAHGPVWKRKVAQVADIYRRLSSYEAEPGVVIAYGSMYGNTEKMAELLASHLRNAGVEKLAMHNLSTTHVSYVLRDIFRYRALVVGGPTYNGGLYPPVEALMNAVASRAIPSRIFSCFGSFTWAGASVRRLREAAEAMKWEITGTPVEMKQGYAEPKCCDMADMAAAIAAALH